METLLARVGFASLAAAAGVGLYAAFTLRSLFADGFLYFLRILEHDAFWLEAPARRTVEWIRQSPLLAALDWGVTDLGVLAVLFGATIQLLPIALTALAWLALPRERKAFFVFPLLHFVCATLGASFAPITEGATAAAYFWILFFALMFAPGTPLSLGGLAALALGVRLLHEGMAFLAPILAAAALWRARHEARPAGRVAFVLLAVWFAYVTAVQVDYFMHTAHPANRARFFEALISLWWVDGMEGSVNLPAVLGIAALGLAAILVLLGRAWHSAFAWSGWVLIAGGGLWAVTVLADAISNSRLFAAQAQFNARNHPLLISLPLALAAFTCALRPRLLRPLALRQAVVLCAVLTGLSLAWHVSATRLWEEYVAAFRRVLASEAGVVAWEDVRARLPTREAQLFENMSHFWIEPSMSIVLAPNGRVGAIVAARREAGWYPFDARDPKSLPRSRFWRYAPAIDAGRSAP